MNCLYNLISTVLGIGYCPIAPGTAASFVVLLIYWFVPEINHSLLLAIIIFLFFIGVLSATRTEADTIKKFGSIKGNDPSKIVIDEAIGVLIAIFAIPKTITFVIVAFVLFRIFDILKPFLINASQKIPRGWGIVIDDVISGIYANILIQLYIILC